jgi:PBP4 family serine-type D-alanyl-D-alanine carboxypeptidase
MKIISADDGRVLYERNGNKLFHPASNMKLLTTATALAVLGTDFKFKTTFQADGKLEDSTLRGNIHVKGVGDPLVRTEHLDSVAWQLRQRGIRRVTGDIVGDVSYFDTLYWGLGWMWDDEPSTDAAFLTPLTINSNSLEIVVAPGHKTGDGVQALIEPNTTYVELLNKGLTSPDTALPPLDVTRLRGQNTIIISGRLAPGMGSGEFGVSVWKPEMYFLTLLRERLLQCGITVHGIIRLDTAKGTIALSAIEHTMDSVLHQINKPSDNLAAEQLLKTIASEEFHIPGSASTGLSVVKQYLSSANIDTSNMILADGSGLSWYNAVSPDMLVKLLLDQYKRTSTFKHFYESLPIAGVDGTLINRMKGTRAESNVHAKTGSLTGVSALSGYVTTADGKMLICSILCNHFPAEILPLRNAQNRIMAILAGHRVGPGN